MSDCTLCHKSLDSTPYQETNGQEHNTCVKELDRRADNNICTMCGKEPASQDSVRCKPCKTSVTNYQNYPGP